MLEPCPGEEKDTERNDFYPSKEHIEDEHNFEDSRHGRLGDARGQPDRSQRA